MLFIFFSCFIVIFTGKLLVSLQSIYNLCWTYIKLLIASIDIIVSVSCSITLVYFEAFSDFPDVEILELCDKLRDDVLPDLGIQLEDHDGQLKNI